MGTTASKQQSKKDGWNISLSHTMSMPLSRSSLEPLEGHTKVPWKVKLLRMSNIGNKESPWGNKFGFSSNLRPIEEETGLEDDSDDCFNSRMDVDMMNIAKPHREKFLRRSVSFQPTCEPNPDCKFSISRKGFRNETMMAETPSTLNVSPTFKFSRDLEGFPSSNGAIERSMGLRSLLTPALKPSQNFASPTRQANGFKKTLASNWSFNLRSSDSSPCMNKRVGTAHVSPTLTKKQNPPEWMSPLDSLTERGSSPLFDPKILATFEKAFESLSDDSMQSSGFSTVENTTSASETSSDADSPELVKAVTNSFEAMSRPGNISIERPLIRASPLLNRSFSFSRIFSLKNDNKNWTGKDYLDRFERRCPPCGEGKVVLYFTSLRAIRKTFEDCCMLRLILKGLRVHVDERDVWMHSKFRQELTDIMGVALPVPRLFILGRHIGGAEEVEQLHEEGILAKMLEGLGTEWRQACEVCADIRFIPCMTCNGSCKAVSEDGLIERCPDCNENGLIMCSLCDR